jgi:lipopolysaccharide/colanic/teichoic acid biosynthesis glycosyltransferase
LRTSASPYFQGARERVPESGAQDRRFRHKRDNLFRLGTESQRKNPEVIEVDAPLDAESPRRRFRPRASNRPPGTRRFERSAPHPAAETDVNGGIAVEVRPEHEGPQAVQAGPGVLGRWGKRAFDLVGASLLILLLAPLWIMIAVLIKADSPGPILFRQRRIGRDGEPFLMLKFRTMVDGADARKPALLSLNQAAAGLFKIYDDPRLTRVGRRLRETWLDELPQLLQVVTGKMSLVGPRPLVAEEDAQIQGEHRHRLSMRPGMTGVWQVAGASAVPIHEMVHLDSAYVEDWTLWLDLKVLARTAVNVLRRRGA